MLGCYVLNKRYTFHMSNGISALSHTRAHTCVHTHTHTVEQARDRAPRMATQGSRGWGGLDEGVKAAPALRL